MHTLMYLMPRLDAAEAMVASLKKLGIGHDAYRIVSQDEDGIRRHHLHDATLLDKTDVIHWGERGALIGALLGAVLAGALLLMKPSGVALSMTGIVLVALLIAFFGAWVGGMAGLSEENYKLKPFHDALARGQYLLKIGVGNDAKATEIEVAMLRQHPEAIFVADDETVTNPFASKAEFRVRGG